MNKYPDYIMRALRQNYFGLDENDTSRDAEIEAMEPSEVFASWLNCEGIFGYSGSILGAIESIYNCSLETREFYDEERCYL